VPVSDRLSCQVQERADGVHLIVIGEIDYRNRDVFDIAVRAVLTGYPVRIVLDLTAVRFVSSEGASSLVDAAHRAANGESTLSILTSPPVRRRLDLLGLTQLLTEPSATGPPPPGP